jgi:hypothetical protein
MCVAESQKGNPAYQNIILASMGETWRRRDHEDEVAQHVFPPQVSIHAGESYNETSTIKLPKMKP